MAELLSLEGASGDGLVQSSCSHQGHLEQKSWLRAMLGWVLSISKGRDSTTSMGNVFQWSTTLTMKK